MEPRLGPRAIAALAASVALALAFLIPKAASGQQNAVGARRDTTPTTSATVRLVAAARVTGTLRLDGRLDAPAWSTTDTVKLAGVVYVLHVFQKKSTRGIATPKYEIAVIIERWQRAKRHHAAQYGSRA